jgi:hypothetical protein
VTFDSSETFARTRSAFFATRGAPLATIDRRSHPNVEPLGEQPLEFGTQRRIDLLALHRVERAHEHHQILSFDVRGRVLRGRRRDQIGLTGLDPQPVDLLEPAVPRIDAVVNADV